MKRKIIAAVFTGMLTAALFPAIAHAEIENPEDYMGIWYANYVIYSDESSERHNVAEYLNQYLEMRLMEDGSAYMEMSYNSEESDSAEILKVSWKLEGGKMREATSEYGDKCYGAVLVDRWNQFTINEDLGNLAEVMTAMANDINSGRVFTAYRTEITEGSENQGAVKFIDEDYEVSYSYQIILGADPMVTLTRYDSEYDYEQVYTNYQLREML